MKLDDMLLMAYVDGELSPLERQEIEKEIAASPETAERVALFSASRLPYGDAFADQKLPPVPESLTNKIDALARAHAAPATASDDRSANDAHIEHDAQMPPSAPVRSRVRVAPAWLAVAFVAGAFCVGLATHFAPGLDPASGGGAFATASNGPSPWIRAVVDYQKLYSRETVAFSTVSSDESAQTVAQIRQDDQLSLRVPDLSAAGLTFKRVTRLRFQGKPLVQIEYLPPEGPPVALCVMKDRRPDQAVAASQVADMNVVTWRQDELHYALVGANNKSIDLMSLGKQISGQGVDQLFGKVGSASTTHGTIS
ncbi:anti-sigma factor family protein [Paraburkholderia rhizosphaerae]|uniref:Anti-sigma factor RsiW n=1 Tax=Paraburkholderia rhizosphaerae TaxID=480658 RepID=A0A4R8LJD5_9BURK|nr:anti-sigma factor [Paraburkholderia rhizosphaerae]TDY42553.1 anti-sigma factor RsiW [Paraburkholderia rhizosphaerae]